MQEIIFFLLLGLGIGSLYAMLGAGLVVIYKGSGVINFAHGAMAMYGVFTFDTAWNRGEFFFPWVDFLPTHTLNVPVRITLSDSGSVPMIFALILALAMAAFIGWAAHTLIFRPLRNAAPLGKVVASLGLALYLQGVALLNFGNSFPVPKSVFPDSSIENFLGLGRTFPTITIYATVAAIILGGGLWALFTFTRFGLATRAAASNEKGAILLGYSPDRLAKINWILASLLATASAIILGPLQGAITPVGLTALIVPALAAALIGGLRSVPIAVIGGFGIGAIQTLLQSKQQDWFPPILENGIPQTLPLIVIVLVLVLRGKSLPVRGAVEEKRLPLAPRPTRVYQHAAVWGTVAIFFAFVFENSGRTTIMANALQQTLVFAVIMLSMVVLTGYVGQISLAQMSLAGIAAFMMARMMANGEPSGSNLVPVPGPDFPWPIAAIIGVAAAVVVGLLIGLPALRIRGVQLAVVTLAAAIAIQSLLLENEEITELRAGVPAFVDTPTFFGIDIGARSLRQQNERPAFVIFAVIVLACVAIAISNMRRSGVGRRFLAVRANERAAAAAGINVPRTKLLAFGISAAIAGIGGVMLAFKQVEVSSANFPYLASLVVLAFAYLGGITSINGGIVAGALTAGALVPITSNYFFAETNIERYVGMLGGLGLIVTAIIHPEGIAPFFSGMLRHLGNWLCTAIPGASTLKNAYAEGSRTRPELSVIYLVLLIGSALFLYNVPIEPNVVRALVWLALLWVITMAVSLRYGPLTPSFAQAGAVWIDWAKRFGPAALAGYVIGWLIWPIRVDTYSMLWMPLLGAGLGLFIRANYRMIRYGRVHLDGSSHDHDDHDVVDLTPADTAEMAEVR